MTQLTVSATALRGAAERIEAALEELGGIHGRLAEHGLPARSGPTELLAYRYAELFADHTSTLAAMIETLRDDAAKLRRSATRYEDTECQNTISQP
jgi:uncharacterized protein YukE